MLAGRLAVLSDAAAELPNADKLCKAAAGAEDGIGATPDVERFIGVIKGDFSTSESL